MFDEISFLVQETFKDVENSKFNRGLFNNIFSKNDENLPEEVPGFFYHLQKKASTFVIRIHPCVNLKEEYKSILKHPDMYPTLRLNEGDELLSDKLSYFECDRLEIAKNIKAQLGNKRFPLFEERVLNVSDPSDSWWLKVEDNSIKILFKLSHTEDLGSLIKLGPLGEPEGSQSTLNQLYGYFKMIFPLGNYSIDFSQWSISCSEDNNQNFEYLKQIFVNGETSYDFWEYLRHLEIQSQGRSYLESLQKANYFMMELAATRNFWKTIQDKL